MVHITNTPTLNYYPIMRNTYTLVKQPNEAHAFFDYYYLRKYAT